VHLDTIASFIYPTDTQLDCSKNAKLYVKIYVRGAATRFGFSQPSSGSYDMCLAKVIIINNQLEYVVYRICSFWWLHIYSVLIGVCVFVCVCV